MSEELINESENNESCYGVEGAEDMTNEEFYKYFVEDNRYIWVEDEYSCIQLCNILNKFGYKTKKGSIYRSSNVWKAGRGKTVVFQVSAGIVYSYEVILELAEKLHFGWQRPNVCFWGNDGTGFAEEFKQKDFFNMSSNMQEDLLEEYNSRFERTEEESGFSEEDCEKVFEKPTHLKISIGVVALSEISAVIQKSDCDYALYLKGGVELKITKEDYDKYIYEQQY